MDTVRLLLATVVWMVAGGLTRGQSPRAALSAAYADCLRLDATTAGRTRYLSLYQVTDQKVLDLYDRVLRFWANSLSREPLIVVPERLAPNLWRIDCGNYHWPLKVWERLAEVPEPFWHIQLVKVELKSEWHTWEGGADKKGTVYPQGYRYQKQVEVKKTIPAFAPWLDAREALALANLTDSQVPIVRLDWWLFQTSQARDRKAGYYDWLDLGKKEADFLALGKADFKASEDIRMLRRAAVRRSQVVHNARGMKGAGALTDGVAFLTEDYATTTDVKNPLRLLDGDAKPDGGEGYITLPNGLFAFWVQNGKGERVDFVPDTIAGDTKSRGTRRAVEVGISCVRCHVEGLRPVSNWVRQTYQTPFKIRGFSDEETHRLRAAYDKDLVRLLARGNDTYTAALLECNKLAPAANATQFADALDAYAEHDRDPAEVAAEVGLAEKDLIAILRAEAKIKDNRGDILDPLLASIVQGEAIRFEHLEEVFALLNEIVLRHHR